MGDERIYLGGSISSRSGRIKPHEQLTKALRMFRSIVFIPVHKIILEPLATRRGLSPKCPRSIQALLMVPLP